MSDHRGKVRSFGPFELSIGNVLLTNGAKIVPLGARAMDLLIVAVEQANEVVGWRTLIERVIRTNFGNPLRLKGRGKTSYPSNKNRGIRN
jgi:DNA-binding winged helix-turn-helix (wHTH) protein